VTWWSFLLVSICWAPVLVLVHEMAHAAVALRLTDGPVIVGGSRDTRLAVAGPGRLRVELGASLLTGGRCVFDPAGLRVPRGEAWIAAAGPIASLGCCLVLGYAAIAAGLGVRDTTLVAILGPGACAAGIMFVVTALPIRYGAGLDPRGDSDGRVIWRVLTGAPPGGVERESRPEREVRPVFALLLIFISGLALAANPWLLLVLVGLFLVALLLQRD
jgi:hypothetical protein